MKYIASALLLCGLATHLSAGAITILNPSFELDVLGCAAGPTCGTTDTITDWTGTTAYPGGFNNNSNFGASGAFGVFKPSSVSYATIPDGVNVAYLVGTTYSVSISQNLGATLLANDTYTLTAYLGERADSPGPGIGVGSCNGFNVALEVGGNILNSLVNAGNASCNSLSAGNFTKFTLTYTSGANPAGLGSPVEIVLTSFGSGSSIEDAEIDFDSVGLSDTLSSSGPTSGVPEPATWGLMLAGAFAIALRNRRKAAVDHGRKRSNRNAAPTRS